MPRAQKNPPLITPPKGGNRVGVRQPQVQRSKNPRQLGKTPNPRVPQLSGRGAYDLAQVMGDLGSAAGRSLGRSAGSSVSQLLGRGAYSVRSNSIMTSSQSIPKFRPSNRSDFVEFEFVEFIDNVQAPGTTDFTIVKAMDLNMGLSTTFPFASAIADNFEETELVGLVLCYESTSGSVTATQGLGAVDIVTLYDRVDLPPSSEIEFLDYEYSSSEAPDTDFCHPIECNPRNNQLAKFYNRPGDLPGKSEFDPVYNLYDLGRTYVAVAGCAAASGVGLGKLWWTYKVRFYKPKITASLLGNTIGYAKFRFLNNGATDVLATPGFQAIDSFVTGPLSGVQMINAADGKSIQVILPPNLTTGRYIVTYHAVGTGGTLLIDALQLVNDVSRPNTVQLLDQDSTTTPSYCGGNPQSTVGQNLGLGGGAVSAAISEQVHSTTVRILKSNAGFVITNLTSGHPVVPTGSNQVNVVMFQVPFNAI